MNDSYLEVLKQYEGEVTGVRRGRGAWICEYPDGPRLLKEYRGTVKRLEFEDAVLGQLEQQGIPQVVRQGIPQPVQQVMPQLPQQMLHPIFFPPQQSPCMIVMEIQFL